jgi:hypothetical protein
MHADNRQAYSGCSACALPGCPEGSAAMDSTRQAANIAPELHGMHRPGAVDSAASESVGAVAGMAPDTGFDGDFSGGPLRGWKFALASFGTFPLPILLAIGGAVLGAGSLGGQLVGAMAGLGIGMGSTVVMARYMWRKDLEHS